eukprot:1060512-Heterocapsa_arctica.AAC.1
MRGTWRDSGTGRRVYRIYWTNRRQKLSMQGWRGEELTGSSNKGLKGPDTARADGGRGVLRHGERGLSTKAMEMAESRGELCDGGSKHPAFGDNGDNAECGGIDDCGRKKA